MTQYYSDESRENSPYALPDVEVFYATEGELSDFANTDDDEVFPAGWYWWTCFPGCLPDSDPIGPFESEEEALADARDGMGEDL